MAVRLVALEDLKPHPRNRRVWDVEEIMGLIVRTGWHGVVIQQESTGFLIAGHGRREAVLELNRLALEHSDGAHSEVGEDLCPRCMAAPDQFPMVALPADVVDVDDDTAARKVIGDNRAQELAAWDDQALAEWLQELQSTELGLAGTGWRDEHLEELVREVSTPPAPPPPESPPPEPLAGHTPHRCPACSHEWKGSCSPEPVPG